MRKILSKYSFVCFFFFIGSFVMIVSAQPPDGPDFPRCCEDFLPRDENGVPIPNDPNADYTEFEACKQDPDTYCNPIVPIDNSIYVYMSMMAAVALASFVIIRKITHKKTPM